MQATLFPATSPIAYWLLNPALGHLFAFRIRKLLLLLVFLISGVGTVRAQQPLGVPALDQLVSAFNAKSVAPLQSYLTPETRVGTLPAA